MFAKKEPGKKGDDARENRLLEFYRTRTVERYPEADMPFFILGCVRSGTTMLRDLLREHPRLACPEETHFFRWSEAFGSRRYAAHYRTSLFRKHREIDGVDHYQFNLFLELALSREDLAYCYGQEYLKAIGRPDARLFDKSPQNVYGLFLLSGIYPTARFVHIYRNPLNVVASLREGKVMPEVSLRGGINYWNESMILLDQFKQLHPDRLLEICYEDLVQDPDPWLARILAFVGEDPAAMPSQAKRTHPEQNKYRQKLSAEEVEIVLASCQPWASQYGYAPRPGGE